MKRRFLPYARRSQPRLLAGLLAAGGFAACARDAEPPAFPAEFLLSGSSAGALPAPVERDSACIVFLMGGSMVLSDGDSYASEFQMSRACRDGTDLLPSPGTSGRYAITGDSIRFWNAQGNPSGRGVLRNDSLIISGPVHTLVYLRSAP